MISRRFDCFLIVFSLIWFAGLTSAATSFAANVKYCPIKSKKSITDEIKSLTEEVTNMNDYVSKLADSKDRDELLDVAYKAICSEYMQNASRLRLFRKAKQKSKTSYEKIKPLIDQIVILLQDFIIDPSKAVEHASDLAKAITKIRGEAKPRKKFLLGHMILLLIEVNTDQDYGFFLCNSF
ncbi:uncharacterized protein MELLADRAFT_108515 [Melampsora larici-populina 98AG31]|uniref:Secreted protein n=1 Tax=Melampsora larici-populina (strain 98AG31 / pathotype 3-4-7) TaxID=747676 RepID=F4RTC2_MELLP|nr:uncharacterized protein MELLADRAFT_108515 [Melampsora larici-populina 98AG31]EGG04370.1 secreted protein [Melampsora larici-populina 98AG31]